MATLRSPAAPATTPRSWASSTVPAIEVLGISKRYGDVVAVDGVSFSAAQGEILALLGPNGAGKSTMVKMLCTLARPTRGTARVAGFDVGRQPRAVRRRIGLVFQEQTLDDQLTAEENLRFHAVLYRVPKGEVEARIDRVLNLVALEDRRRDLVATFSGGMARRLEIARSMLHTPAVLFLDEPTVGLDPQTRALMWEDVTRLRAEEGVTVLLTTHYMDEAEYADRIAIIDHGRLLALDRPQLLKRNLGADRILELKLLQTESAAQSLAEPLRKLPGVNSVEATHDGLRLFMQGAATGNGSAAGEQLPQIVQMAQPFGVRDIAIHEPSLETVFIQLTGRDLRE